jgi:hypothetical protein
MFVHVRPEQVGSSWAGGGGAGGEGERAVVRSWLWFWGFPLEGVLLPFPLFSRLVSPS